MFENYVSSPKIKICSVLRIFGVGSPYRSRFDKINYLLYEQQQLLHSYLLMHELNHLVNGQPIEYTNK